MEQAKEAGFRTVALVVSSSLFMQYFDSTALITALPAIARAFGRPVLDLNILISCYALAVAILIPVCNVLASRFGAKRAFMAALAVFVTGSLLAAFSFNLPTLLCARLVQATGAAMTIPVGRLIVVQSARPSELVSALNWLLIPSIVGPVMGPPVSGFLVTYGSWQSVFLVVAPIGVIGILAAWRFIPDHPPETDHDRLDIAGTGILAVALGTLIFGFNGLTNGRHATLAIAELLASMAFIVLYVRHALGHPAPVLRLELLRIETFRQSMLMGSLLRILAGAAGFLVPLLLQLGFGLSAAASGAITFALPAGALASRFASNTILRAFSLRSILIVFTVFTALTIAAVAFVDPLRSPIWARLALGALGFVSTMPLTMVTAIAYIGLPEHQSRAANGFYTTVQQLTISIGVMAATAIVRLLQVTTHLGDHAPGLYATALYGVALIALAGVALAASFAADAGEELRPHRA